MRTGENLDTWFDWLDRQRQDVRPDQLDPAIGAPVDNQTLRETSERIDELLDELGQSAVPAVMERVEELLRSVMSLYGAGLDRVLEIAHDAGGDALVGRLADDEVVGNLLVLHGLHPDDVQTRVQAALDQVRPYLGSHAGGVELLGVDAEGVAHLKLEGSCDGCASSALTVQSAIEDAILVAAPDVVAVEAEGMVEPGAGPAADPALPLARRSRRARLRGLAAPGPRRPAAHAGAGAPRRRTAGRGQPGRHPGGLPRPVSGLPRGALRGSLAADVLTCGAARASTLGGPVAPLDDSGGEPAGPRASSAGARGLEGRRAPGAVA